MPFIYVTPEVFIVVGGTAVYHAYKDDFADQPLDCWFQVASQDGYTQFDIRDLDDCGDDAETLRQAVRDGSLAKLAGHALIPESSKGE